MTAAPPDEPSVQPRRARKPAPRQNVAAVEATYRFIVWLIPVLEGFARTQRFLLGDRIQNGALAVLDCLIEAAYTRDRLPLLRRANLELEKLRFWMRLANELRHLDFKRYEFAARAIDDIGRQVGGWIKQQGAPAPAAHGDADAAPA
ncbi:MAG: diversity-generating retroelement protein Avd [Betaproteobacteria bacterium]